MKPMNVKREDHKELPLRHILFYTRLFLYLFVFAIPIVHPAVVVPYDRMGWWLWFGVLPGEMLIAFYLRPPRLTIRAWAVTAALPILGAIVFISGFSPYSIAFLVVGTAAFLVTAAIFHGGQWGKWLALPEPFLLAILYFKMLSFTRASEQIAAKSEGITQAILVIAIAAFLLHSLVLYFSTYRPKSGGRGKRELILFVSVVVPAVLAVALLVPPNFVSHRIVLNSLDKKVRPKPVPLDLALNGLPGGNLRSPRNSREQGDQGRSLSDLYGGQGFGNQNGNSRDQNGGTNTLEGVPSDQWNNGTQVGEGPGRQYAVMIVKSKIDPVYAADAYYGKLEPVQGFVKTPGQSLNDLTHRHLLETWKDVSIPPDIGRQPDSIFFLSTIPDRVLSYLPYSVEPTVLDRRYYPFSYSYDSVSLVNVSNPRTWLSLPGLDAQQKQEFSQYLQVPLTLKDKEIFQGYLNKVLAKDDAQTGTSSPSYVGKLVDILRSFSTYQYKVGFTDNVTIAHLVNFLTKTKTGDCTEFSNTTAVLARLAGIPARVVTGYLAAKELQTPAHLRGLAILRSEIKPLQKYPLRELYLVTTADRHSWVQVWLPQYGWVDIETTSFAIPPTAGGDPNNWNVVIPLITGQQETGPVYHFPWGLALRFFLLVAALVILITYLYRYGREIYLLNLSRGRGKRALEALYKLLLLRLAVNAYDLKAPSQTPREYAHDHPELTRFADLYTELRYRESMTPEERERLWRQLKTEYRSLVRSCRKGGFVGSLRRAFGLKGLYYRW